VSASDLARTLRRELRLAIGSAIVLLTFAMAIFGEALAPFAPREAFPTESLDPPSSLHWMGTDNTGMDVFSRVLAAARIDILLALSATAISAIVGVALGVWAGYYGGSESRPLRYGSEGLLRVMDVVQAFPVFILALALVASIGQGQRNILIAVSFVNIPVFLRLTRSVVLSVREQPYIEAARCSGASDAAIMRRHVLPNAIAPAIVNVPITVGWSILLTAALSFVGAGIRHPTPEWGSMIATGAQTMITGEWWPALFPGLLLGITVVGYGLVGDGLRRRLAVVGGVRPMTEVDPRMATAEVQPA
jgi:peptide/nickel transport system permease protein